MYVQRQQLLNNLNWERNLWQYGMHTREGVGGTGGSKYIIGTQLKCFFLNCQGRELGVKNLILMN